MEGHGGLGLVEVAPGAFVLPGFSCFSRIDTPEVVAHFRRIPAVLKPLLPNMSASLLVAVGEERTFRGPSSATLADFLCKLSLRVSIRAFVAMRYTVLSTCVHVFCVQKTTFLATDRVKGSTAGFPEAKMYTIPCRL